MNFVTRRNVQRRAALLLASTAFLLLASSCSSAPPPVNLPKLCDVFDKNLDESTAVPTDATIVRPAPTDEMDSCEIYRDGIDAIVTNRPGPEYEQVLADLRRTTNTPIDESTEVKDFIQRNPNHARAGLNSHSRFFDISVTTRSFDAEGYAELILNILERTLSPATVG